MALYEITQDCRIANKEYQKGDIVSDKEVGWYYTTVMKPTDTIEKPAKKVEAPVENTEVEAEKEEAIENEEVEEKVVEKPKSKRQSKKK